MDLKSMFGMGGGGNNQANQNPNQNTNQNPNQNPNQGSSKNLAQGKQQPQNPNQIANIPGNQGSQNTPGATNDPNTIQSPLDAYTDLFAPSPKKEGEPEAPRFQLSPEAIQKAAGSMDFLSNLPPELAEALQSGQDVDFNTVMKLMNHVGRNAYTQTISHMSHLVDRFSDAKGKYDQSQLGTHIKGHLTRNTVENLPQAKHPAIKEGLKVIAENLQRKHPDATPEWIAEQSYNYFVNIAQAIAPEKFGQQDQKANSRGGNTGMADFDWDNWIENREAPPA